MSDDIKKLVQRLDEQWDRRRFVDSPFGEMSCLLADAADALEAMAEKLQRETKAAGYWMERFCASENERDQMLIDLEEYRRDVAKLTEERDRLKAALDKAGQFIADEYADPRVEPDGEWLAREARPIYAAICEALEGREWERLPNEKVAGVAALEAAGAGLSPASGQAPATDPAPAVCEWTPDDFGRVRYWQPSCSRSALGAGADEKGNCYICGKPIKFTEAKE